MIKNRIVQVIYQTIFCTLALFGLIGSLGYFDQNFNINFYVYYTNLSNYLCMGLMVASLVMTIKKALKKEEGEVNTAPTLSFLAVIMILVTFLVYNILLAKDKTADKYFLSASNLLMHLILPLMFIIHWILFYKHGKLRWYHPLLCVIMPLIYVVFILIRALIVTPGENVVVYPYFFLDVNELGYGGLTLWVSILVIIFIIIGYIFYFFDNYAHFKKMITSKLGKKSNTNTSDSSNTDSTSADDTKVE